MQDDSLKFRKLRADEIECRVGISKEKGCTLLLYKDARCDMNILDETVGSRNWQRHHSRDNANCIVSIWDKMKNQWIEKEDVGTESNTEKEKGIASDSFKRACVNWGIGRELYTSPFIWVPSSKYNNTSRNGKFYPDANFEVAKIAYDEAGNISALQIINTKLPDDNQIVYTYLSPEMAEKIRTSKSKKQAIVNAIKGES